MHRLTPEGLQGVLDVPLYGRVAALQLYRPASEPRDLLLLLTERNKFCVLGFDEDTGAHPCPLPSLYSTCTLPSCGFFLWGWDNRLLKPSWPSPRPPYRHAGELVTRANGDASDRVGRQVEAGQRGIVDPECRLIGLHLYDGLFKACLAVAAAAAAAPSLLSLLWCWAAAMPALHAFNTLTLPTPLSRACRWLLQAVLCLLPLGCRSF